MTDLKKRIEEDGSYMKADLHCHSRISDGSWDIAELVVLAKRTGIDTLSITDHDTAAGINLAKQAGKKYGIHIIPGIEISAYDYARQRKAHVLGYFIEDYHELEKLCRPIILQREEYAKWVVNTLGELGYAVTWELAEKMAGKSTNVYKQHIMHALMHLGYAYGIYDELYDRLFAKPRESIPGGLVYQEIKYIDVFTAVKTIKQAGGVAVLAHPAAYKNMDLVPELLPAGLDGLEAWHPQHNLTDREMIESAARKYDLLLTGGSDFHGLYEGRPNLLGSCYMTDEWLQRLYDRKNLSGGKVGVRNGD